MTILKTTTTKATHRGIQIAVMSERQGSSTMYSCTKGGEPVWFATQGEAIANERYKIDEKLLSGKS